MLLFSYSLILLFSYSLSLTPIVSNNVDFLNIIGFFLCVLSSTPKRLTSFPRSSKYCIIGSVTGNHQQFIHALPKHIKTIEFLSSTKLELVGRVAPMQRTQSVECRSKKPRRPRSINIMAKLSTSAPPIAWRVLRAKIHLR